MSDNWEPGTHVLLRCVLGGRVLSAQPHVVVRDTPDVIALWMAPGTVWMKPTGRDEVVKKRLNGDWHLHRDVWAGEGLLRLSEPGGSYSVLVLWASGMREVDGWYVNLEEPLRRTALGFDFLDQLLDVRVTADRQKWRWKDEDEFNAAVEAGLIDRRRAIELRAAGEEAVERIRMSRPPFDDEWRTWRPAAGWTLPALPQGWDTIAERGRL